MTQVVNPFSNRLIYWLHCVERCAVLLLVPVATYFLFFHGTYLTQDDYVWLCFSKFFGEPVSVFWTNTLCGQFFRPIGQLWWVLIHSVAGEQVVAYQFAFLAQHLLNSALATRLARHFSRGIPWHFYFMVFACNPLFVAADSRYFCFIFDSLGFTFYLLTHQLIVDRSSTRRWTIPLSLITAGFSYFSKEAFFTLPGTLVLAVGLSKETGRWNARRLRSATLPLLAHSLIWIAAILWRARFVSGLGGYGLMSITSADTLLDHLFNRAATFVGFAAWSICPGMECWETPNPGWLCAAMSTLAAVTWCAKSREAKQPGVLWIWLWMGITWSPSVMMTTHAPISWYTCTFASTLLFTSALQRVPETVRRLAILSLGGWYAWHGVMLYQSQIASVNVLRTQHRTLQARFPLGGREAEPGARYFLLRTHPDLHPDAAVKYQLSVGDDVPDVLFLNDKAPVNWVIANSSRPFLPGSLVISDDYQDGFMEMNPLRAYPIEFSGDPRQILQYGPPFRFLLWEQNALKDITNDNPFRIR